MNKYRKKAIEVNAIKFTNENKDYVYILAKSMQQNIQPDFDKEGNPILLVPTLEGEMACSLGDYLIEEPFPTDWRKIYPCKSEIFEKLMRNYSK